MTQAQAAACDLTKPHDGHFDERSALIKTSYFAYKFDYIRCLWGLDWVSKIPLVSIG
ncbi:MAG: hypothetical protein ACJAWQ_002278 [Paraglaciecola sp.]|jgi:hypothetical protein